MVDYEVKRQKQILEAEPVHQETRRFIVNEPRSRCAARKGRTISFSEPNIPPIQLDAMIDAIRKMMPELPEARKSAMYMIKRTGYRYSHSEQKWWNFSRPACIQQKCQSVCNWLLADISAIERAWDFHFRQSVEAGACFDAGRHD